MSQQRYQDCLAAADCLFDNERVEQAIDRMAVELTEAVADQEPLLLCVMNGAIVLAGKLLPRLPFALQVDHVHATRYRGELQGADLQWLYRPAAPLDGRCVVLVDDILDEGDTLAGIRDWCLREGAARVLTAVLVDKQHDRRCQQLPEADHTGLVAPDRYLFGYGMDVRGYWRNAPGIYALRDPSGEG